jgi:hypothetical protein
MRLRRAGDITIITQDNYMESIPKILNKKKNNLQHDSGTKKII